MYDTTILYIIVCDSECLSIIPYNCTIYTYHLILYIYVYYLKYYIYYCILYAKDT